MLESLGELLMIIRFAPDPDSPTSGFKVFSRIGPLALEDDGSGGMVGHPYIWSELDTLGGRMLFVGRGCSRSYETADYPGFKDGMYFSDDRSFYDEQIMFRGTPAATPASGRKGRLPMSSASSRSRAHRTTLLRLGFSLRRRQVFCYDPLPPFDQSVMLERDR
jgi:hypothetical protein